MKYYGRIFSIQISKSWRHAWARIGRWFFQIRVYTTIGDMEPKPGIYFDPDFDSGSIYISVYWLFLELSFDIPTTLEFHKTCRERYDLAWEKWPHQYLHGDWVWVHYPFAELGDEPGNEWPPIRRVIFKGFDFDKYVTLELPTGDEVEIKYGYVYPTEDEARLNLYFDRLQTIQYVIDGEKEPDPV